MRNTLGRHRGNHEEGGADRWSRTDRPERRPSGRSRRRRRRGRAFTALAGAFALLLGLGATGWYVLNHTGGCSGQDVALSVAVSPELAPSLEKVAADFNKSGKSVEGRCVKAEVRAAESADITYGITGTGPASGEIESDVWIPDSSLWSNLVKEDSGQSGFTDTGTSVASSPLVLALPAEAEAAEEQPSWSSLVPTQAPTSDSEGQGGQEGQQVQLVDPVRSSSGMATLALVAGAIGQDGDDSQSQLVAALQALQSNVAPDQKAAFNTLAENPEDSSLLVLSEQAAWQYNQDHGNAPAQVGYPDGGTYTLDYPFIDRSTDPMVSRAADLFREALTRDSAQQVLLKNGFRTPDGDANQQVLSPDAGFKKSAPDNLPTPSTREVQRLAQAWNRLKLDSRLLTVVDVSGSMLEPVPGTGMNRMQITAASAGQGLELFPEGAALGLWRFSVGINEDLDYEEVLPIRDLGAETDSGATQKEAIASSLSSMQPVADGDTGLYDTYLAAYRQMSRTYKADRVNSILLLTDGNNDDANSISLDKLISTLKEESSPVRPIPIFTIAFGPDIDPGPLEKVAEVTGGAAYTTEDPTEIGDIFLKAFSQRLETEGEGG